MMGLGAWASPNKKDFVSWSRERQPLLPWQGPQSAGARPGWARSL